MRTLALDILLLGGPASCDGNEGPSSSRLPRRAVAAGSSGCTRLAAPRCEPGHASSGRNVPQLVACSPTSHGLNKPLRIG